MSMEKMKKEAQEKVFSDRYRTGTWSTTEWENGFEAGWNSRDEVPRCDICGRESGLASGIGFFDACNCRTPEERLAILRNSEYFAGSRQTLEAISPQLSEQQLEIARLTSALEVAVRGFERVKFFVEGHEEPGCECAQCLVESVADKCLAEIKGSVK